MTVDLLVLIVLAVFALLGLISGAARQLGHWVGLVAAWLAARPLAALVGPPLAARLGTPDAVTTIVCGALCFMVVYAVAARLVRALLAALFPEGEKGAFNHFAGMLLGAAKAAALCYLVLCVLVLFDDPVARAWPGFRGQLASSVTLGVAQRHNALAPVVERARRRASAASTSAPGAPAVSGDANRAVLPVVPTNLLGGEP